MPAPTPNPLDDRHGGVTCHICGDPIPPIDYWAAFAFSSGVAAHVVCLWTLQAPVQ